MALALRGSEMASTGILPNIGNSSSNGDQSEISGNGSRPNCCRQDYRHLRSSLWISSVQTLAAAIYSCLRSRSESLEQIESTRRGTSRGGGEVDGVLVSAWLLATWRNRDLSARCGPERIS